LDHCSTLTTSLANPLSVENKAGEESKNEVSNESEEAEPDGKDGEQVGGEEHPQGHHIVDDAHQVGGEGEVHGLGEGGQVQVQQQEAKEEQVEVEVEAPGCKAKEGYGDEKYVGKEAKLDEDL